MSDIPQQPAGNPNFEANGKFKPGNEIGKLGGRPKGSLDFKTKFNIFLDKLAKQNEMSVEEVEQQLFAVGFSKAKAGDYNFYKDIHDRVYGRAPQTLDVTSDGEKITNSDEVLKKAAAFDEWFNEHTKGA